VVFSIQVFRPKILYHFSPLHASYIILHLITLLVFGEPYRFRLWSSSLCSLLHPPATTSLSSPGILLRICSLCCFNDDGTELRFALTGSEDLATAIAAGSELRVIAVATVDLIGLGAELLVHKGHTTLVAQEAGLMPVLVFVGQVLEQTPRLYDTLYSPEHSGKRLEQVWEAVWDMIYLLEKSTCGPFQTLHHTTFLFVINLKTLY